jgi:hypothetical protein
MFRKISVMGLVLLFQLPAHADDWGCQVALCMSNPAGPTAVAQCIEPMRRLYNALRNKQGWPSCGLAQAPSPAPTQFNSPIAPQAIDPNNALQGNGGTDGVTAKP